MSLIVIAALVMGQAPAPQPPQNQPIVVKKETKQVCKLMEVTGSHTRQRVCRNEFGELDLAPNVKNAASNPGMIHGTPGAAKGGVGGVPQ